MKKIGLLIGHSRHGDEGAYTYDNKLSEWDYNTEIVKEVRKRLIKLGYPKENLIYIDDYKTSDYYESVKNVSNILSVEKCEGAIEFHFNAASASAKGFEYIHYRGSKGGIALAKCFANNHKKFLNQFYARDEDGVLSRVGGRGSQMLKKTPCPFVIAEPFFGTNKKEADYYRSEEGKEMLIEIYTRAIIDYSGGIKFKKSEESLRQDYIDLVKKLDNHLEEWGKSIEEAQEIINKLQKPHNQ